MFKLGDNEKTLFITNQDTSDGVRFVICNSHVATTYDRTTHDGDIVVPKKDYIALVEAMQKEADKIKNEKKKDGKFLSYIGDDIAKSEEKKGKKKK